MTLRNLEIEGVEVPIDIPVCHREMYAEWVKRGKPQMEFITPMQNGWIDLKGDPKWLSNHRYRIKAKPQEHDAGQPTSALRTQVGGDHYAKLKIQPAEYCHANGIGHMAGDAISYITRYKDKNGKQDLLKAIHSLQLLIELEYGDEG